MMISVHKNLASVLAFLVLVQGSQRLNVQIQDKNNYCIVVPKDYHTNIGDSERPDGTAVWCHGAKVNGDEGTFSGMFWNNPQVYKNEEKGYIQIAGCVNVNSCDRLNPSDDGGQYDSNGGDNQAGNPVGSQCVGYNSYVELIEPAANRACIRCCQNPGDCNLNDDTKGCPTVIPGDYYNGCN